MSQTTQTVNTEAEEKETYEHYKESIEKYKELSIEQAAEALEIPPDKIVMFKEISRAWTIDELKKYQTLQYLNKHLSFWDIIKCISEDPDTQAVYQKAHEEAIEKGYTGIDVDAYAQGYTVSRITTGIRHLVNLMTNVDFDFNHATQIMRISSDTILYLKAKTDLRRQGSED